MIKFGTGGWRAIIGDEFTKSNIQILTKAMALKMKHESVDHEGIVIGYDRRFLSKEAVIWSCEVFAAEGIKTFFINRSQPTPLIMFYVMKHQFHYGMMVTASHNPAIYNGIKVFTYGGRDADETQTKDIESYIRQAESEKIASIPYDEALKQGMVVEFNPINEYIDNIIAQIDTDAIRKRGLKIVLDPMYGVSKTALSTIFLTVRCDIDVINDRHDTLFGGKLPSPSAGTLKYLQQYVLERHCDLGIATDGDADRLGVIEDKGRFLHPNDILMLLYYYLIRFKKWKGPIVRNLSTTHILDRMAEKFGEKCYEVPVGFKHISAKMRETNAVIGGESSGGLTVRGHINGKDGIYAASLLVEMLAVTGKKLSEVLDDIHQEFGSATMIERDYKFSLNEKERIFNILFTEKSLPEIKEFEFDKISYLDGCKIYFKNGGWILARFSGTEPLLRIVCEMPCQNDAEKLCDSFEKFLGLRVCQ
jgi:phosphomannomutase